MLTASAARPRAARHEPTDQGKPPPGGQGESGVGRRILAMRNGGVNTRLRIQVQAARHEFTHVKRYDQLGLLIYTIDIYQREVLRDSYSQALQERTQSGSALTRRVPV